ncbi:MAG: protein-L-isoaspartate O-methyltransferase family protein [Sciscionella sp.]
MTDLVSAAAATIDYDDWTTTDDGDLIPQITTDTTIHDMLRLLNIQPGMTVLEIGTGSGYSGSLLSCIVGTDGHVVSIDIDPSLVERARAQHEQAGHTNIELHAADGYNGWAASAPFDRIVGWVTPHVLPTAWVEQAKPGAVIVTPVKIADIAGTNAIVRCVVDGGTVRDGELYPGSFIEMAPEIITELGLPIRYVDAVRRLPVGPPWWISAHQLHQQPSTVAADLLAQLVEAEPEPEFFDRQANDWRAFTTFLLASTTNPAGVGGAHGWGIGTATPNSVAVSLSNGALLTAGTDEAHEELTSVLDEWRKAGKLGLADLSPSFTADEDGWAVRPQLDRSA